MKDILLNTLMDESDDLRKRNRAREFLQARILLSLQDQGAFADWAFLGGTALRFLYDLPRYSEDLDFSLRNADCESRLSALMKNVESDLDAEAYTAAVRVRERSAVAAAFIKFSGLLYELGLSAHKDEVLAVKVEIDTNPPDGARFATRLIRRHYLLNLLQYDRPSLLAGKLHAVLTRKYTKGRDLYDLMWYLSAPDWPPPNLILLNSALQQSGWENTPLTDKSWTALLCDRLQAVDWKQARNDVAPFIERKADLNLISPEIFEELLRNKPFRPGGCGQPM